MRFRLPALLLLATALHSQPVLNNDKELYERQLNELIGLKRGAQGLTKEDAEKLKSPSGQTAVEIIGALTNNTQKAALTVTPGSFRHYLNQVETIRQMGASGGASGSTSVTISPVLADIFGFSLEQGSLTKAVSGSTATFQLNPAGIFCASRNEDAPPSTPCADTWKRVTFSFSFDQDRSSAPQRLVALRDQFSEARVHVDLRRSTKIAEQRLKMKRDELQKLGSEFWTAIETRAEYREWVITTADSLASCLPEQVESIWYAALDKLRNIAAASTGTEFHKLGRLYRGTFTRSLAIETSKASQFAFEAGINRPDVAKEEIANGIVSAGLRPPSLFTTRLIYSRGFGLLTFVANGSASWFTELKPGMNRGLWRDYMLSAEARFRLREIFKDQGAASLSFGGLFGNLRQAPLGIPLAIMRPGATTPDNVNIPGTIKLFNARLEVPTANRAVVIPVSFTYSNRSDLIKEEDVRASIGISLRFDSFFPAR